VYADLSVGRGRTDQASKQAGKRPGEIKIARVAIDFKKLKYQDAKRFGICAALGCVENV
jgi:hypothetical protein